MNLHFLHTLSGCAIVFFVIGKITIHYYLDYLHGKSLGFSSIVITPLYYLLPYNFSVNIEYTTLKHLCNLSLVLTCISLFLNILLGILVYGN